jgi:hypothetical protein
MLTSTNEQLNKVIQQVDELISWAEADAQHADENNATDTAEDDRWRARTLRRAKSLLIICER